MAIRRILGSICLPVAGMALLITDVAGAHHGATVFDRSNPIVVSGVVREFRWTSPHAWILLDVPAVAGAAAAPTPLPAPLTQAPVHAADAGQWAFEGASVTVMVRNGWKSGSLHPGDRVKVLAAPRRDGTRTGEFISVTLTDSGKVLQLAGP
jgi:hypothetical protein